MTLSPNSPTLSLFTALALCTSGFAQEDQPATDVESRLDALEQENAELHQQLDALAGQVERVEFRDIIPTVGDSVFGMGPAASKVYAKDQGLSLGGYGEGIYQSYSGSKQSQADFLRWVLYAGYKFDDNWVFNSEIELEHATTSKSGSASVEFAYLEYLHNSALNVRAGLLLAPMGFINEMHEPTTFYGASRPEIERRIIPSTWRENGVGVHGGLGAFDYKLYAMNSLDASGFDEDGLRGGRQKGSKAKAEDIAFVGRLDYTATPGLLAGFSGYFGNSGQSDPTKGDVSTAILDLHLEYQVKGLRLRALYTMADLGDTEMLSAANGAVVGEKMAGYYVEAGYDLMTLRSSDSKHQVIPFLRYETLDTHDSVAAGLTPDPTQDETIITAGVNWLPIDNIVFKMDYQDFDQAPDRFQLGMGYVF